MTDPTLDERLRAVERALTDADRDLTEIETGADLTDRVERVEDRLEALDDQVSDLEAAVQAVRGYVGSVRAVNREVEGRADRALSTARALERRIDGSAAPSTVPDDRSTADPQPYPDDATRDAPGEAPDPDPDRVPDPWGEPPWQPPPGDYPRERNRSTDGDSPPDPDTGEESTPQESTGARSTAGPSTASRGAVAVGKDDQPTPTADDPGDLDRLFGDPDGSEPESGTPRPVSTDGAGPGGSTDGWWVPDDGVELERGEPWSVPGRIEYDAPDEDGEAGLLDRVREALE